MASADSAAASSAQSRPAGMESFVVGLIGMGDMGKMYAQRLSAAGWNILACDRDDKYEALRDEFVGKKNIQICRNGHFVSRASDYIIYSVEAATIDRVIAQYAPSTKLGAIVGGQTSCKDPEIQAFERHLPADVDIVSCHSLHGPGVDPLNQPLVIIPHRASAESVAKVETVLSVLRSKHVHLSAKEHDRITADTQAWHVYAGLAILNPEARKQISQYARSVTDLYKLMLEGDAAALRARVFAAKERVFGSDGAPLWGGQPLLDPGVLEGFSLGRPDEAGVDDAPRANNHLSLLAMVDCWAQLGIVPYNHMVCSTPLFRLWLGVTEHVFRSPGVLEDALRVAIDDLRYRSDDLEFTFAARGWAESVSLGNFETWKNRFETTQAFFEPRFKEAGVVGNAMMKAVFESSK
ncbi:hypothetical protein VDGE_05675 [Verticillium dahliae]|uniref:Prephenate/arogenate dehydrogenase domain-containing protein n=1 Tax=Verticillium dahliae TaxID=27337 RepID=A0A444S7F9_VERDA|nr:hypothetical protein VDGE_05675 [Verticillium dahliae]